MTKNAVSFFDGSESFCHLVRLFPEREKLREGEMGDSETRRNGRIINQRPEIRKMANLKYWAKQNHENRSGFRT